MHTVTIEGMQLNLPSERLETATPKEFRSAIVAAIRELEDGLRLLASGHVTRPPIQERAMTVSLTAISRKTGEAPETLRKRVNRILGGSRWFNLGGEPHIRVLDWVEFLEFLALNAKQPTEEGEPRQVTKKPGEHLCKA